MIISKITNNSLCEPIEISSLEELSTIIKSSNWAPSTFKNNYRNKPNFESTVLMVLDIDEGCSLDNAHRVFGPYRHIIATTRNHQKEKHGIICDRFRVVLFLNTPIESDAVYTATWLEIKKQFPFIDDQCKDSSRYFYASPGEPVIKRDGLLITPSLPVPGQAVAPKGGRREVGTPDRPKGKLSRSTLQFMIEGAPPGSWNGNLFKAAKDFYEQGYEESDFLDKAEKITGHLDSKDLSTISSAFKQLPKYDPRYGRETNTVEVINRCHLYVNSLDSMDTRLIDHETGEIIPISLDVIRMELGAKVGFPLYMAERSQTSIFTYDPKKPVIWKNDYNLTLFNEYQAPKWKKDVNVHNSVQENSVILPNIYERFFTHLTNGDQKSFDYLLDWLATSLQSRNLTILCAIGKQGTGKGLLGAIMSELHGAPNFVKVRDTIFKERFNGALVNKTLVYVDEASLDTKTAIDRIKDVVNPYIEVEAKGKDARNINNHASFYLSSNDLSAIKLESDDRRFSILEMTDIPLRNLDLIKEVRALTESDNIKQLGIYLLSRSVQHNMLNAFVSKRTEDIKEAGLAEWEAWVLQDLAPGKSGKSFSLNEFKEKVAAELGLRVGPNREKIKNLCERYPKVLRFTNNNGKRKIEMV